MVPRREDDVKRIVVRESDDPVTRADSYAVEVDWFPRLTEQQLLDNLIAREQGRPAPHEDQNLIEVLVVRSLKRLEWLLRPDSAD